MQSNIQQYYPSFYTFYESHFFPGQTCIPDLSHDSIWAIWLAEVRKFHQHHDRICQLIGSVNCDVTGPLWRHQKAVSCLGWDKSISDTRRLSRTPGCTRQIDLRLPALVSDTRVYETNRSWCTPCVCLVQPCVRDISVTHLYKQICNHNTLSHIHTTCGFGAIVMEHMWHVKAWNTTKWFVYNYAYFWWWHPGSHQPSKAWRGDSGAHHSETCCNTFVVLR